ncbi:MAG TPA: cation-translocating P-type ATPase [Candidatus Nanoarchaeia archaeon]|nr:cation-translocating P-type ATPase [Candidatus Nanoarchaeia archaeon]
MPDYYTLKPEEVIKLLDSSKNGLSEQEAKKRLQEHGSNELQKGKKITVLDIILAQFRNWFLILLVFAGVLSFILGDKLEGISIFAIMVLNVILGFIQEYRAERAMEALEKLSAPTARVLRDGKESKIPARELVQGDIILLEAGDIVPADSRILEVSSLQINEASLTGESIPSKKYTEPFKPGTSIADQENMAFMGTTVTYGKGKSIITATGMKTEFGKIAKSIQAAEDTATPLQVKFGQLAKQIGMIVGVLILLVFAAGITRGTFSVGQMLLYAVILTVSTIPNSLPLIVTVSLSLGARRLARKNMLIRKLPAAESLGAVTIICSDKTGTITKNQMTVTDLYFDNQIINVTGAGYEPAGNFYAKDKQANPKELELLLRIGYLCNNAKLVSREGAFDIVGDPTEGSLIVLGKKGQLVEEQLQKNFSFIHELPFDSDRKRMTVIHKNQLNKKIEAYVKGAPDLLLKVCDRIIENGKVRKITEKDKQKILRVNHAFGEKALRILGVAYKELPDTKKYLMDTVEKDLIFVGLVGMIDPPRDEVKQAVAKCKEAGIKVMIITGDHAVTTKAVAQQIGLFNEGDLVLTGDDVEKMSDEELAGRIDKIRIIARALPIQKSRVVDALQKRGHIVAMTGDGVNDAPALKKADIGIAMGITGTDVAKEVSKGILVDDNFATIVNAIQEGRNIYDKMVKSTKYLLSCNFGEITSVFIAIMLNFPLPILPLQILLMNILTDDFPALGLGFESSEEGIMKRPPRSPRANPLSGKILFSIILFGIIMCIGTLYIFSQYKEIDLIKAQTMAFTTLVMFQLFAVISSRSLYPSLKKLNPFTNLWLIGAVLLSVAIQIAVLYWAPLQTIFSTTALTGAEWLQILGVSSLGFIMMELSKFLLVKKKNNNAIVEKS